MLALIRLALLQRLNQRLNLTPTDLLQGYGMIAGLLMHQ
jgi:hypothetical protein